MKLPKVESRREAAARREQEGKELGKGRRDGQRQTHRPSEDTTVGGLSPERVRLFSSVHWWEAELVERLQEETWRRP